MASDFLPFSPRKLISLADMIELFAADRLVRISDAIQSIGLISHGSEFPDSVKNEIKKALAEISKGSGFLSLPMTQKFADRLKCKIDSIDLDNDLCGELDTLQERFRDESDELKLFLVRPIGLKYYANTTLAGEQFKTNFPISNSELIEAGNCYALDRYTACVSHLVRAAEKPLVCLETALGGLPPPLAPAQNTWGLILGRIKGKISDNDKTPLPDWANDRDFFFKSHAFLAAIKVPIRDDTMHVRASYDEQGATDVMNVMTVFFRHVAIKLAE